MKKRLLNYQPKKSMYGKITCINNGVTTILDYNKPFDVLNKQLQVYKRMNEYKNAKLFLTYIH